MSLNSSFTSIKNFPFHHKIKTRWKDLDAFGHINNSVFATYIEDARFSLFDRWDIVNSRSKKSIIAAALKLNFKHQLTHPSNIIIAQRISRIGKTSFDIHACIFDEKFTSKIICDTLITCVCFNYETQQPVRVYKEIINDSCIKN
jgi:acyl-CoA thioester hydrolase